MSRFLQTIYSRVFRPYKVAILIVIVLVVFLSLSYFVYNRLYATPDIKRKFSDVTNNSSADLTITIYFFNVDWCPHCTKSKPEWNTFSKSYDGTTVNGYKIKCVDQNCTKDTEPDIKSMIDRYHIESYPTIIAVKPDDNMKEFVISYDARVTNANLEKFVESITNG